MEFRQETVKRILFVGIVALTFVFFVIACVFDIISDEEFVPEVLDTMGEAQSDVDDSTDNDVVFIPSSDDEQNSEATSEQNSQDISQFPDNESNESEDNSNESTDSSEAPTDNRYLQNVTKDILDGVYINSPHCIAYNITNNTIIAEKNAYEKCFPASVTKMLTAAVALEYVPVDTVFTVGSEIKLVGYNSSMAYISEGETYTLKNLLYALLLPSGNDAAYTIAVNTARYLYGQNLSESESVEKFMNLCNEKAVEIGAYNTNFTGPDGYHNDNHYTTAYDMLLICLYATSFEEITEACGTYRYYCKSEEGVAKGWLNTNPLLNENGQYYCSLVTGLKTGSTDEAGKCLATMAEKNGEKIIIIVLSAPDVSMRNSDTLEIIYAELGN